ncbi:type I glutamate--ammonia ligase [Candidatus Micrarchaeota archaeon]|nr:type I glutamate--ammonia ligase [Candidatus Micrarchaeota archaeon]MBU2477300.1 type I glutamate--ammonia ligase [Candidatus Micrarchaeota archaeon]
MADFDEILSKVKEDKVEEIVLQFTDVIGSTKSVYFPVSQLNDSLENGTWFDGSSIEGFARIHESDMFLKPDPSTYAVFPWNPKTARFICDVFFPDGKPFSGDPRFILKKAVAKAKEKGFVFNTGPELEFFLFENPNGTVKPVPHDTGSYFDFSSRDLASNVRSKIVSFLSQLNVKVESSHHEVAFGQHEIDFEYRDALTTADRTLTFKQTVKSVASSFDLFASFMPKPVFGINGSGMHVHQSLSDLNGKNLFFDSSFKHGLSELAMQFIAGQLLHIKAMSAILSPTVNSYKRLVPGFEAPVNICWATINRSALIRVPRIFPGKESSARIELRCPDPSSNPYLAFAVMLEAGLDGIEKKLKPDKAVEEDVYDFSDEKLAELNISTLPFSLSLALTELEKDEVIKNALGEKLLESFLKAKKAECLEYNIQVSEWELKKYFHLF